MSTATLRPKPREERDVPLFEAASFDASRKVDTDGGVIRGVKVLGASSKNGRTYTPAAMKQAAALYEGVEVCVDHDKANPARERSVRESFGELRSVELREGAIYADLHFVKSHPLAAQVCESAERFPARIGLSHNAVGSVVHRDGGETVTEITRVRSVDLVTRPATNRTMFESEDAPVSIKTTTLRALLESHPRGKTLLEEDMIPPDAMAAPVDVPSEGSSDDQIRAAFRSAVMAAFDDEKLDSKATLKKIGEILKAYDKLTGAAEPKPEGPPSDTPESVDELRRLRAELAAVKGDAAARTLLESHGVDPTPARVAALSRCGTDEERAELAATWPRRASLPSSSPPLTLQESAGVAASIPTDAKAAAARWFN